jgi:hypothetical protein
MWPTADDDIGGQTEEHEDNMGDSTPTDVDDLEEAEHQRGTRVSIWSRPTYGSKGHSS